MSPALLLLLAIYAAIGLVVSMSAHVLALAGEQPGGTGLFFALHAGIFPLWIPVVLLGRKVTSDASKKKFWNVATTESPRWLRYLALGLFVYALINFALFIKNAPDRKHRSGPPPAVVWRGFSGHWMAFYSAGLLIVVSAYRRSQLASPLISKNANK